MLGKKEGQGLIDSTRPLIKSLVLERGAIEIWLACKMNRLSLAL